MRYSQLQTTNLVLHTTLQVVDESRITRFYVYLYDELRTGMHYSQELYGLIHGVISEEQSDDQLQDQLGLYQLGYDLLLKRLPMLMTVSQQRCALWVNMRHSWASHHQFLK